jgi:hypothetical protein
MVLLFSVSPRSPRRSRTTLFPLWSTQALLPTHTQLYAPNPDASARAWDARDIPLTHTSSLRLQNTCEPRSEGDQARFQPNRRAWRPARGRPAPSAAPRCHTRPDIVGGTWTMCPLHLDCWPRESIIMAYAVWYHRAREARYPDATGLPGRGIGIAYAGIMEEVKRQTATQERWEPCHTSLGRSLSASSS